MSGMILTVALILALQTPAAPQLAGIDGTVRNAESGQPLPNVQVAAVRVAGTTATPRQANPPLPPVFTDTQGHFAIKDLPAGTYRLFAVSNGFGPQEYAQRLLSRTGKPIDIEAGKSATNILFLIAPSGTVTGHVTDAAGEAVAHVTVKLLLPAYDANGKRSLRAVDSAPLGPTGTASATTDDRGEYRIFWVPPGRYYLSATVATSTADSLAMAQGLYAGGNGLGGEIQNALNEEVAMKVATTPPSLTGYGITYYPGTLDTARAGTLEVPSGGSGVTANVRLIMQPTVRVRGRLIDGQTGQPPRSATILLNPQPGSGTSPKTAANYSATTGAFEIIDVAPGSYTLSALTTSALGLLGALSTAIDDAAGASPGAARGNRPTPAVPKSAIMHVDITSTDIDNIVLKTSAGASIKGQITVDGTGAASTLPGLDRIRVRLQSTAVAVPAQAAPRPATAAVGPRQVAEDGSFTLMAETNCICELTVTGLPPDAYIKSIRLGSTEVIGNLLTVPDPLPGPLQITIGSNGGRIDGTLIDKNLQPLKGIEAVLIPEQRSRQDLYKTVVSDTAGHFTVQGIPPGAYKLFAWEDIEANSFRNADILRPYESQGQAVTVGDSAKIALKLTAIPAPR